MMAIFAFNELIQEAALSTCQVMLTYIYINVSVYWPLCVLCVFACVCDIKLKTKTTLYVRTQ